MASSQMPLITKLQELADQHDRLQECLSDPQVLGDHRQVRELSVRRAALADLTETFRRWERLQRELGEYRQILAEDQDADLLELARSEVPALEMQAADLLTRASEELVTADDRAVASVILELRAGTGGAEAALFTGELLAVYRTYARDCGWTLEVLDAAEGEQGGLRHVVVAVEGEAVWQGLGYESGVHCVKRVPATETQGRIHTSTATVAVLPEPEELDVQLDPSEVVEHITTAQGPGGQNVNKVATAVHLIHLPTGIEVRMQESKSQRQNREKAWQLLRARIYDRRQQEEHDQRDQARLAMIGSAGRSERIRTYRWKDNIVVDHRLGESFNLQSIMAGQLRPLVRALLEQDKARRLAAL